MDESLLEELFLKNKGFQKQKVLDKNGYFSAKFFELPTWRVAISLSVHRRKNGPPLMWFYVSGRK